ncbi:MAG TPA: recombinase family protein, partial [Herpetosiphonaceae bacterium]|nr:recombinase family protein [Herpetosiphonaceae bacterium]
VHQLQAKDVALRIVNMGIDTNTPTGKLMLNVLGGVAEFEREMMLERQREGIAKAEGRYKGRKPTAQAKAAEVQALKAQGLSMSAIACALTLDQLLVAGVRGTRPSSEISCRSPHPRGDCQRLQ